MRKYRSVLMVVLATAISIPVSADEGKSEKHSLRRLKGEYLFTQTNHCVTTRAGELPPTFDRDTLALVGPADMITIQGDGVTTFDGRGGFKVRGSSIALVHDRLDSGDSPVLPPLPVACVGTYSHDSDGWFVLETSCTTPAFSLEGVRIRVGVGKDRDTIIFSDREPAIETLRVDGFPVAERICVAMATDVKAKK